MNQQRELQPFFNRRHELTVIDGCILWGGRIVVPHPGRPTVLKELHDTHVGISKMKSLAGSYVWWPSLDGDIERIVRLCTP